MLLEALEYLTTPCPPLARRHGYLAEMVALGARYRRQRTAWAPHVASCHRFIADAVCDLPRGGRALVVGSGRLIEVPLPLLAERFDEVVLVDMLHTWPVRRAARRLGHVRLLTIDVTGALAALDRLPAGNLPLPAPVPPDLPGERFAFAVSCNLLSQLPVMPLAVIDRTHPGTPDAARTAFAQALLHGHLAWLARVARWPALYSDIASLWVRDGQVVGREDSLWGLRLSEPDRRWTWDIAPTPEEDTHHDLRHTVGAWLDASALADAT
ncbi:hypothetical protein [Azospirillum rugosum]|uniref:Methyltransferase domain-containing protein n=1 Tax=Azospirillum rugosum TaxID=416170 RepID=A0ABS4T0V7_9PROT|nr:hypothetical protein [Azospirillum rugosum]MBP2297280.1 hypothetical protein [Azospirillum rugosum]MDQ0531122.1 hypothetical protein [Azospirillum rugosum]